MVFEHRWNLGSDVIQPDAALNMTGNVKTATNSVEIPIPISLNIALRST